MSSTFYILSGVVVTLHSFLNFKLCAIYSESKRFHSLSIYLACLLNGLVAPVILSTQFNGTTTPYFICLVILLVEMVILFKGNIFGIIGVTVGSLLHLFVIRGLIVTTASMIFKVSFYEIVSNITYFPWINILSFVLQLITLTLFIRLIPINILRRVMADKSFYTALLAFSTLLIIFIIINTDIFYIDIFSYRLAIHEMIIVFAILLFFYIMLIMMIWVFNLEILKERNKELEVQIQKDKALTTAVFNFAEVIIEANCTKDIITRIVISSEEKPISKHDISIGDFFSMSPENHIYHEDCDILKGITANYLQTSYNNDRCEIIVDYRSRNIQYFDSELPAPKDEPYLWHRMKINLDRQNDEDDIMAIISIDEIDKAKQEEINLRRKAETDPLTGSYNKKTFGKKVDNYIHGGYPGALFMFDLDNFKGINDNMGHSKGDEVLIEVCEKITTLFREQDLVGRIGGDEFVIFLQGEPKESIINKKAKDIINAVKQTYYAENGVAITITSSIGIAIAGKDGNNFETLFKASDIAMYHSKSAGKNTFTIYDKSQNTSFVPRQEDDYSRSNKI